MYIIPATGDFDEVTNRFKTAGIPFETPKTVRDYILNSQERGLYVAAMSAEALTVMADNPTQLLAEWPAIVDNVPGLLYPPDWRVAVYAFPTIDWLELEKTIQKSGTTAFTPEVAAERTNRMVMRPKRDAVQELSPIAGVDPSDDQGGEIDGE